MKNIELEVNLQKEHIISFTTAFPLCILLSDNKYLGWYYENYMKIFTHLDNGISFQCDFIDSLSYNCDGFWDKRIIEYNYISKTIMEQIDNIHIVLKEMITTKTYCIIFIDEYYIKALEYKEHFAHEILIYGYDDYKNNYLAIVFKRNKLIKILISYKELEKAYKSSFKYINERDGWESRMLILLKKVNHSYDYEFSNEIFLQNLEQYINSKYLQKDTYLALFNEIQKKIPNSNLKEGIAIKYDFLAYLRKLQEDINMNIQNLHLPYKAFHTLRDHKNFMYHRITYFIKKNNMKNLYNIILEYEIVVKISNDIRLLFLKLEILLVKKDYIKANNTIEYMLTKIEEMFTIEKDILEIILEKS